MDNVKKSIFTQGVKGGLISLVFSCVGVLILALFAKLFGISENILPIINQVLKALSVLLGVMFSAKDEKFVLKAVLSAVVFWLLSFLMFSALGGGFNWGQSALDLGVSIVCAFLAALMKSKR